MELIKDYTDWLIENYTDYDELDILDEDDRDEYREFFKNTLQGDHGHSDLKKLSKEDKKKFFNDIGREWNKAKKS